MGWATQCTFDIEVIHMLATAAPAIIATDMCLAVMNIVLLTVVLYCGFLLGDLRNVQQPAGCLNSWLKFAAG